MQTFTPEEKAAYKAQKQQEVFEIKGDLDSIVKGLVAQINEGKSEGFLNYLKFCASLHTYSARNAMLIEMQCGRRGYTDLNHVASFQTWLKHGYVTKKGEKGLAVLVPIPFKKQKKEGSAEEEETGIVFRLGSVFADCQVRPLRDDVPPIPVFFKPLAGDCNALTTRLRQVIEAEGISITQEILYREKQGYSAGKYIALKVGLDSVSKFLVLLHEFAHELLHQRQEAVPSQEIRECHAEAIAYIVSAHFGVENPRSSDYLLSWRVTEKILMSQLEIIQSTARLIIQKMSGSNQQAEESD